MCDATAGRSGKASSFNKCFFANPPLHRASFTKQNASEKTYSPIFWCDQGKLDFSCHHPLMLWINVFFINIELLELFTLMFCGAQPIWLLEFWSSEFLKELMDYGFHLFEMVPVWQSDEPRMAASSIFSFLQNNITYNKKSRWKVFPKET